MVGHYPCGHVCDHALADGVRSERGEAKMTVP